MQKLTDEKRIEQLFSKIQIAGSRMQQLPAAATCLFGNTGAGKTTSSYLLSNIPLEGEWLKGQVVYKYAEVFNNAVIGHTNKSQTQIPNFFKTQENLDLVDCPGFLDTNKFERIIGNAFCIYNLFAKIGKIKFIITINQSGFSGKGKQFEETILQFLNMFHFDQQNLTVDKLTRSCALLITKVNIHTQQTIVEMIDSFVETYRQESKYSNFNSFLDGLRREDKIHLIPVSKKGQKSVKNKWFIKIYNSLEYWVRQKQEDNLYDMRNVNFQINESMFKNKELALANTALKSCDDNIDTLSKVLTKAFESMVNQIQKNNLDQQNFGFIESLRQTVEQISIQKQHSEWKFNCTVNKCKYFNKIKFLKTAFEIVNHLGAQKQILKIDEIQKSLLWLLENMISHLRLNEQQVKIVNQFAFLLNRKYQQIKVLSKIKKRNYQRNNRQTIDWMLGFITDEFENFQRKFIVNYNFNPNIKEDDYYQQLIKYFQKYKDYTDLSNRKPILLKLSKAYKHRGQLIKDKVKAVEYIILALQHSFKYYEEDNKAALIKVDTQIIELLANICQKQKLLSQALQLYKVTNNINKTIACHENIYSKLTLFSQKYANRLQLGDYLMSVGRTQKALEYYQQALYYANEQQKQIASARVISTFEDSKLGEKSMINQYIQKIKRKEFYNPIPPTFNFDSIVQRIQNNIQ